jgi:hypothetical protein
MKQVPPSYEDDIWVVIDSRREALLGEKLAIRLGMLLLRRHLAPASCAGRRRTAGVRGAGPVRREDEDMVGGLSRVRWDRWLGGTG